MFPYHRLEKLYQYIDVHTFTSAKTLSDVLGVSERTIRSDIQVINDVLEQNGAKILLKRKNGYYVDINDKTKYQQFQESCKKNGEKNTELESSENRIKYLFKKLLYSNDYTSLDDLADMVFISKNTVINYMKTIKAIVGKYQLEYIYKTMKGVKIIGSEKNKRKCMMDFILPHDFQNIIIGFTKEEYAWFSDIDLDMLERIISSFIFQGDVKISDYNQKNLIMHFALMLSRIQNHCEIDNLLEYEADKEVMRFLTPIFDTLSESFHVHINQSEKLYLYSHFISNTNYQLECAEPYEIDKLVTKILYKIEANYHFDLRSDMVLIHDLTMHLKSICNSKLFFLNKRNPLLNTIKKSFPLAYGITLSTVLEVFKNYPVSLTEDEIGYVALHIGASIERFNGVIQKKDVILICGSGQATARMLEARLNVYFKDKINVVKKLSYSEFKLITKQELSFVDFAISTVVVETSSIPIICVDFTLNKKDIESLSRFLTDISTEKKRKLDRFFNESIFIKTDHFVSKECLLAEMCKQMQENEYIDATFYDSVLYREQLTHTNMNKVFALPHPMELCAKQTKVAVAILDTPLCWNENATIQIVMLLAVKQDEYFDIEHLYDLFLQIVNNTRLQQSILHSNSFQEFIGKINDSV